MAPLVLSRQPSLLERISITGDWSRTALSNDTTNVLSKVFFVNQTLDITSETTVTAPDSASKAQGLMLHTPTSKTLM